MSFITSLTRIKVQLAIYNIARSVLKSEHVVAPILIKNQSKVGNMSTLKPEHDITPTSTSKDLQHYHNINIRRPAST